LKLLNVISRVNGKPIQEAQYDRKFGKMKKLIRNTRRYAHEEAPVRQFLRAKGRCGGKV